MTWQVEGEARVAVALLHMAEQHRGSIVQCTLCLQESGSGIRIQALAPGGMAQSGLSMKRLNSSE